MGWKTLCAAFVALLYLGFFVGLTGCREDDGRTSSVSCTFDTAALARAANGNGVYDDAAIYTLVLALQGDYVATKTVRFSRKRDYLTVRFDKVPVGAKIYSTADVFKDETRVCSGASGYSLVESGGNLLSLVIQSVVAETAAFAPDVVAAHAATQEPADDALTETIALDSVATEYDSPAGDELSASPTAIIVPASNEAPIYNITFNANGGTRPASQQVPAGERATAPQVPTRVGYRFAGWFSDRTLRKPFDFSTAIDGDATLYAKWTATLGGASKAGTMTKPIATKESRKRDGANEYGAGTSSSATMAGDTSPAEAATSASAETASVTTDGAPVADVVYIVDFDANGGSDVGMQALEDGDVVLVPAVPVRAGYRFAGWYADGACTQPFDFASPVHRRMTLYAKWEALEDNRLAITCQTVTPLYLNGGAVALSATLTSGTAPPAAVDWQVALRHGGADVNDGTAPDERRYVFDAESRTCRIVRALAAGGAYELYVAATYNGTTTERTFAVAVDSQLRFTAAQLASGAASAALASLSTAARVTVTGAVASSDLCRQLADALLRTDNAIEVDLSSVSGLVTIREGAFSGCGALSAIILPPSLSSVAARAFAGCSALLAIRFSATDGWQFAGAETDAVPVSVTDAAANAARLTNASGAESWQNGTLSRTVAQ